LPIQNSGTPRKNFLEGQKYSTIRSFVRDDAVMTTDPRSLKAVLREMSESSERSTLFWWMVENHRQLKASSEGRRLRWDRLSITFSELGLADVNGNPPKPGTARQTWLRARRFVSKLEKRSAARKRPWSSYPSHMSKDFRPAPFQDGIGIPEQSVPALPPQAAPPDTRVGKQPGNPMPPAANLELDADTVKKALSALDKTDGYLNLFQPKRST
jgi:hypothetical protein